MTAIRSKYHEDLFGSKATIGGLVQVVITPNVGLRGAFVSSPPPTIYLLDPDTAYADATLIEHEMEQF